MKRTPISSQSRHVTIITGAPGSGKLVHAYRSFRELPIYCCFHHNKAAAWSSPYPHIVLLCYASQKQAKQHWIDSAERDKRSWSLYVMSTSKEDALKRMWRRPHDNKLEKEIDYWYRNYTPHQDEWSIVLIDGPEEGIYT